MKKKRIPVLMVGIVAVLFWAPSGLSARGADEADPLRFGSLPAISAVPIIYAEENGYFDTEGVTLDIVPFNSPTERNVALQADQIDAFIGDVMTAVAFRRGGFPVVITSDIVEDFKLLSAPGSGIFSIEELDGGSVSLVPNFVLEYIMDVIARENRIEYETIVIPSISARFEALLAGRIDAVLFTEPQASLLAGAGASVIAGSGEYGIKAGAMIFREAYTKANPEQVKAFYRAYNRAVEELDGTSLGDYSDMLAAHGFPPDVASRVHGRLELTLAAPIPDGTVADVITWMESKGTSVSVTEPELTNYSLLP
ncbi:MAG: ABC transporter substrate-binding protein [Spirochaetaceae bacterium]|nr:ABC transporter substrate-binding protein [Spirochaetaceae bacterium]